MKAALVAAAAAALIGSASASHAHEGHRHVHELFHAEKRGHKSENETCVASCTTIYSYVTGAATLYTAPPSSTSSAAPVPTTSSGPATVPTPIAYTCPTPGTYSFPATTVTLTETTTVCAASTTTCSAGTHTLGGVTTVVETETTVVCPYATTSSQPNGVVTSVIMTTTYVCPSAGTYTIAPVTVTVEETETVVVVPVVTTYCPGTYTAPAVVTTITETDTVIYCPFATPAASAAPAPPAPAPAASHAPAPAGGKGQWAMTYTPYNPNGGCKTADEVYSDVSAIKAAGFTTLRLYSTDCNTLPNVGAACSALGLKVIVGIFIGESGVCYSSSSDVSTQITAIVEWAQWDLVEMVVVTNEAMFNGYCSVSELVTLISDVKSALGGAGYSGPYTTTDVVSAWQAPGTNALCSVMDAISANCHAFFNPNTTPDQAGTFVAGQIAIVQAICPSLPAYILESGWPHDGSGCNDAACPGDSEQATALSSIQEVCGSQVAFFSFCDDPWKAPGDFGVEPYWGCGSHWGAN